MTDEEASAAYGGDFAAIEAAVLETPRGRWFLAEFARRNRTAETDVLLQAIQRLEHNAAGRDDVRVAEPAHAQFASTLDALNKAKASLAEIGAAKTATSDILKVTERLQELAWELRETGATPAVCDELDRGAARIYTACAFQEQMAERIETALEALRAVEEQPAALTRNGSAPVHGDPEPAAEVLDVVAARTDPANTSAAAATENDRSSLEPERLDSPTLVTDTTPLTEPDGFVAAKPAPVPLAGPPRSLDTLLAIDRLEFRERVRLFT